MTLTKTDRGVWASGAVEITAESVCSRCLKDFDAKVTVDVDDVFLPTVDVATGAKLRYEDELDQDSPEIDAHHVLDLTDVLRQYRLASFPLAPLCKPDCKGLCPECGTDWNESTCTCGPRLDTRWDKLRELLK